MKRAIFVASVKGGVGKTLFSRGVLDRFRRTQRKCAAYDCDAEVGQLMQYYGTRSETASGSRTLVRDQDPLVGVRPLNILKPKDRDRLFSALDLDADVILYDLPGGLMKEVTKSFGDSEIQGGEAMVTMYNEAGYAVTVAVVITPFRKAILAVSEAMATFGPGAEYLVIVNRFFGDDEDYARWDAGETKKRLLKTGGKIIELPKIQTGTLALLDEHNLSFMKARDEVRKLSRLEVSRVQLWMRLMDEELFRASDLLGFEAVESAPGAGEAAAHDEGEGVDEA